MHPRRAAAAAPGPPRACALPTPTPWRSPRRTRPSPPRGPPRRSRPASRRRRRRHGTRSTRAGSASPRVARRARRAFEGQRERPRVHHRDDEVDAEGGARLGERVDGGRERRRRERGAQGTSHAPRRRRPRAPAAASRSRRPSGPSWIGSSHRHSSRTRRSIAASLRLPDASANASEAPTASTRGRAWAGGCRRRGPGSPQLEAGDPRPLSVTNAATASATPTTRITGWTRRRPARSWASSSPCRDAIIPRTTTPVASSHRHPGSDP